MTVQIIVGDCRQELAKLASGSVHCAVSSPPYMGLRDYGMPGQIGLEGRLEDYVAQLVAVCREVRRVLRDDGTFWLNLGDSYAGSWGAQGRRGPESKNAYNASVISRQQIANHPKTARNTGSIKGDGLKPKDLMGVPWRVAFALQADGWYLRQDIIWHKPNPMPESVTDRCTKAHEYIFLLTKSPKYFYDAEAIAEPASYFGLANQDESGFKAPQSFNGKHKAGYRSSGNKERKGPEARGMPAGGNGRLAGSVPWEGNARNKRSVWTVPTKPYADAHFATFPPALIEPCIKAGCPEGGTVLDPFGGAGTTGLVADRLRRNAVLIELNPKYAAMARRRIHNDAPLFAEEKHVHVDHDSEAASAQSAAGNIRCGAADIRGGDAVETEAEGLGGGQAEAGNAAAG